MICVWGTVSDSELSGTCLIVYRDNVYILDLYCIETMFIYWTCIHMYWLYSQMLSKISLGSLQSVPNLWALAQRTNTTVFCTAWDMSRWFERDHSNFSFKDSYTAFSTFKPSQ